MTKTKQTKNPNTITIRGIVRAADTVREKLPGTRYPVDRFDLAQITIAELKPNGVDGKRHTIVVPTVSLGLQGHRADQKPRRNDRPRIGAAVGQRIVVEMADAEVVRVEVVR